MNDLFEKLPEPNSENIKVKKTKKTNGADYTAKNITILEGLEPVRKRPGMYIGGVDSRALHHLFNEVIDNAVDEVVAGHASAINVMRNRDNELVITDNGRGIPIDSHPKFPNKSALEIILTTLHAGGKFDNNSYKTSGGLHGVGISVVNALSEYLSVEVVRDKSLYRQDFARGKPTTKLENKGKTKEQNGTTIRFRPDNEIFEDGLDFNSGELIEILKTKAYLVSGLKITFTDASDTIDSKQVQFYYPNGIADIIEENARQKDLIINSRFTGSSSAKSSAGKVEWSIIWAADRKNKIKSFCNTIPTINGGTHENAFKSAILKSIKRYGDIIGIRNTKIITLDDLIESMDGILSIFIADPEFQGQTKEKLSSKNATTLTSKIIEDNFDYWLSENPTDAEKLISFLINTANTRINRKHEKDLSRKSALRKLRLPGKLADCLEDKAADTELFIVEGDSAGGSAKQARDKKYQAVLPLRGKILNIASSSAQKYFQNQQLKDLVQALGCGTSQTYDEGNLRYDKIIIMTDADVDGAHIASLLITFFYIEMPELINKGHLYVAVPPLYKLSANNKIFYAIDDEDRERIIKEHYKKSEKIDISRFKGLGEMLPNQLRETTMNKSTRKLLKITMDSYSSDQYAKTIDELMGNKPDARFKFIQENANFN